MFKLSLFIGQVLIAIACGFFLAVPNLNELQKLLLGFGVTWCLSSVATMLIAAWGRLGLLVSLIFLTILNKPLRISFASLIRIKVDNKYFLVKSDRHDMFQPVGGVLKFYDQSMLKKYKLTDDNSYSNLDADEFRLRFQSGDLWNVFDFLSWFESKLGRETDPHREFYEELIDTNIFDRSVFSNPQFEFLAKIRPPIKYGKHFKIHELFIFEIFELRLNDAQNDYLRNLMKNKSDKFVFVSHEQIESLGFSQDNPIPITPTAKHIL